LEQIIIDTRLTRTTRLELIKHNNYFYRNTQRDITMGNNLDICSNGRAESENNMKDMQGKGSNTLDNRNITSDLQSILTSNRSGTRSSTRSSRSGSTSSRSKAMQSNWTSREEKMQLLASKLSQSDSNKSRKVNEISLMLSRHANTDYSSPENRTRSLTEARDSYSHSESWSKTKMLEESLCNPHTSSAEVMSRFEFLSVEERHLVGLICSLTPNTAAIEYELTFIFFIVIFLLSSFG
jgi:hypothetical protein